MTNGMMGQPWDPTKTPGIGTGEGEVPLAPPAPKLDVRTMMSDQKSMQQSGSGMPRPYTPQSQEVPGTSTPANTPLSIPSVPVPPKSDFVPSSPFSIPSSQTPIMAPKKSFKGMMKGVFIAVIIIGLGALGYFVLYPMIFSEKIAPVNSPVTETPPVPTPNQTPVPTPTPTPTPVTTPESITSHVSLFKSSADTTENLTLASLTLSNLKSGIPFDTSDVPMFKEIAGRTAEGTVLSFKNFAQGLAPLVFTDDVTDLFESDFSVFALTDQKGTWIGFVAEAKSSASLLDLQKKIAGIETRVTAINLYLQAPGTPQEWKSGTVGTITTRYEPFAMPGASFNYGWMGNYLVVSASYDGLKEALKRLE